MRTFQDVADDEGWDLEKQVEILLTFLVDQADALSLYCERRAERDAIIAIDDDEGLDRNDDEPRDEAYERAAARARQNDFELTGGKDWT